MDDGKMLPQSIESNSQDKSVSEEVLEYYTKHSLNPELPKYFCGDSSFQITNWHGTRSERYVQPEPTLSSRTTTCNTIKPIVLRLDNIKENIEVVEDVIGGGNENNPVLSSPVSSIASNRKLEWDNGADIGYSNALVHRSLKKSISLPVLNKFEYKKLQEKLLGAPLLSEQVVKTVGEVAASSDSNVSNDARYLPTSSSTGSDVLHHQLSSSSSAPSPRLEPPISSRTDSFSAMTFIPNQIGTPIAESTAIGSQKSPVIKNNGQTNQTAHPNIDINTVDRISYYKHFKMLKLTASKPVVIEARNTKKPKDANSRYIQTSLVRNVSIGVQTESHLYAPKVSKPKREQQSVFYIYHSDSDADPNTISSSVQTDSELLSNHCQSFEFLCGDALDKGSKSDASSPVSNGLTTSTLPSDNSNTSSSSPLAQLLAAQESNQRIPDFYRKVRLLRKMLVSCKYNDSTKKFYLKQVLKKMFDTKYVDDTIYDPMQLENLDSVANQNRLLPSSKATSSQDRNLNVHTFSNEILPQEAVNAAQFVPIQTKRIPRNQFLTLTGHEIPTRIEDKTPLITPGNLTSSPEPSSSLTWRDNKTRSEQMLEGLCTDDSSVKKGKIAQTDDLAWINKEIQHLNKLKKKLKQNALLHSEGFTAPKQSTAVYVLATENVLPSNKCSKCQKLTSVAISNIQHTVTSLCMCKPPDRKSDLPETHQNTRSGSSKSSSSSSSIKKHALDLHSKQCVPLSQLAAKLSKEVEDIINSSSRKADQRLHANSTTKPQLSNKSTDISTSSACSDSLPVQTQNNVQPPCIKPTSKINLVQQLVTVESLGCDVTKHQSQFVQTQNEPKCTCCGSCSNKKVGCNIKQDKLTQTSVVKSSSSLESASSSSQTSSTSKSSITETNKCVVQNQCKCCYHPLQESTAATPNNSKYILCATCYVQNQQIPYYTYPGHVCKCHNQMTQVLDEIRDTVKELNILEKENYCNCRKSMKHNVSDLCLQCKRKIKNKHKKKKGIAYMLTLEPELKKHKKVKKHQKAPLQEIIVKVPYLSNKRHLELASSSDDGYDKENSDMKNSHKVNKDKLGKKRTLQDYLFVNKPDFITSAERRRRCLIELAYTREEQYQKYKQIVAALADISLTKGIPIKHLAENNKDSGSKHLFTASEMKEITAKHYKTLPEVQKKLVDHQEKQIKKANKLLTDIFNQKVRQQALKGKLTIPITTSIIKLN